MKKEEFNTSLPNFLFNIWCHLTRRRRHQFQLLLCLMIITAFAEVVSLGAVLPFLGILVAPEQVFNYPIIKNIAQAAEKA